MAVQAQYAFLPDSPIIRAAGNAFKDQTIDCLIRQQQIPNRAVEQTCINASGSRKRRRDVADSAAMIQQFQNPIPSKIPKSAMSTAAISTSQEKNWLLGSASASTVLPHPLSQHIKETDALIHLHNAKLQSGLHEIHKRHCAELLQICETQAAKRITEKDAEIEGLKRRQAELEARLSQMAAENQIWFTVARNSEALVSGLRAKLDQALRRSADGGDCHVACAQAEDAESCYFEGDNSEDRKQGRLCKVCRERDVSVLLLPCRHLCLCSECEPMSDTCPVCYEPKNVGLQVFME